ncbi:hypothetical protein L6164_014249 [Bauhinia variegata]|uniref:Uncharacterized protein n=1 Tax=Bauhinia variegata TaxID=167791 RepID=A0ACB9NHG3_BAUVA|nr:hypothetical protein L6164_014249 [Bauhinia variegata]
MGATNSRPGSRSSTPRVNRTNRFRLSSLLCGGSSSRSTYEMEDLPTELRVDTATDLKKVIEESSLTCCTEARISSTLGETATSSDTRSVFSENIIFEGSARNVAADNRRNCLCESRELVPPRRVSADHESFRESINTASTSFVEQRSSDPVSVNVSANKDLVNKIGNSVDSGVSQIPRETMHPMSSTPQEHGGSSSDEISLENPMGAVLAVQNSVSNPVSHVSNLPVTSQLPENEPRHGSIPSGLGLIVSNREGGQGSENVLHLDVVTISSNTLSDSNADASDHDARRNGRRLFWDSFSQRSSRRLGDSPTIVFSAGDTDDPGSHDQWLLDLSGDFSNDGVGGESGYIGSRIHRLDERMRHSRSEIWERLRGGLDEIGRWNSSCPLGLHPDGLCQCDSSPITEESSTRASISRIVMLAEALFEVLDEIHRQPVSLSLSMVSLPAPESIVDSFPLKCHKKDDAANGGDNAEQCYICLSEYEEGEKIRVLPCNHEYHMSCVDKWLKEIHGVCPLCRGYVCGGFTDSSASNTQVPSQ